MGLTSSEKHNRMMDRVYSEYDRLKKDPAMKSMKKNRVKTGKATHYHGDQYPGPKHRALEKRAGSNEKHESFTGLKNRTGEFQ